MRTLDQIYWDCLCDAQCGCKNLEDALGRHPKLQELRDGTYPRKMIAGATIKTWLTTPGYELRLRWQQVPYDNAPEMHWSYRENFCESGDGAHEWLQQFLSAFEITGTARNVLLARRKVGQWEHE